MEGSQIKTDSCVMNGYFTIVIFYQIIFDTKKF